MKNTDPYKAGDAYSVPPFNPSSEIETDGFTHEPFTSAQIGEELKGILSMPYLGANIEDRPDRAFRNIKVALEMCKRNVFGGDSEEERECRHELTIALTQHEREFDLLRDFSNVFARMSEHIEIVYESLCMRLVALDHAPDTDPGGLGRDTDLESRLMRTIQFINMLKNVHAGRDPITGAQECDVEPKQESEDANG